MTRTYVGQSAADTSRLPSDSIWNNCPWTEIFNGQRSGVQYYDDFPALGNTGANAQVPFYKVVGTGGTLALLATNPGGLVEAATGTTSNNEAYGCFGNGVGAFVDIINNTPNEVWFEARFALPDVSASGGYFVGLTRPADMASGFLTNTTFARASTASYIGFGTLPATPTKLDIVYNTASGTETVYKQAAATLTANGFVKVGFHYYGGYGANYTNTTRFYVNGAPVYSTAGADGVTATSSNFPASALMNFIFAAKTTGGSLNAKVDLDWWRVCQIVEDTTFG